MGEPREDEKPELAMALEVVWTERASLQFDQIKAWVHDPEKEEVLSSFVNHVFNILDLLSVFPEMGMVEDKQKGIRGFLVSRHHRLFYRLTSKQLIILAIFDQRMDQRKKALS